MMNQEQNARSAPNDPKLSDCGGRARPLHGGGQVAAEAAGVTDRSSSLQRMVRRCGLLLVTAIICFGQQVASVAVGLQKNAHEVVPDGFVNVATGKNGSDGASEIHVAVLGGKLLEVGDDLR
jgi:hypothetical protein